MELFQSDNRMIYRASAVAVTGTLALFAQAVPSGPIADVSKLTLDGALLVALGFMVKTWLDERKRTDLERERNARKDEQILAMTENTSKTLALATSTMERVEALFVAEERRPQRR